MSSGIVHPNAPVDWQARWIWHGEEPRPFHFHLFARRRFYLPEAPSSAVLHVTAADRYVLMVNGRRVGRGPETCDPRRFSFDSWDVAALLRPGANAAAIHAYSYGCTTGYVRDGRAGLLAQLEVAGPGGRPAVVIATDESWRVRPGEGWRRDVRQVAIGVGLTEVLDLGRDPADWAEVSFDDSAWATATPVIAFAAEWSTPEPRATPALEEGDARPVRILGVGESLAPDDSRTTVEVPELLGREIHEELRHAHVSPPDALVGFGSRPLVASTSPHAIGDDLSDGIRDPFILLDFGRQLNGYPRFTVEAHAGDILDVAYGEQLVGGRIATVQSPTRCADRYILRDGRQTVEEFEWRSFRYLQLSLRTGSAPMRVLEAGATTVRYPAPVRGSFTCSDSVADKLWRACVATTELCTWDSFMDSPLREKRNWFGDGSHAVMGALAAWGDTPVIRRYFALASQAGMGDGMLRMFFPGGDFVEAKTRIVNTIPQHALVWAARVGELWRHSGDRDFLRSMVPTLEALAGWCARHANTAGLLDRLPYGCWLDWTPLDIRGSSFATNAFYLHLLDELAVFCRELGRGDDGGRFAADAAHLRATLRERFWDPGRGRFCDAVYRGHQTGVASELGNALALLYGIADEAQARRVAELLSASPGSGTATASSGLAPATPLFFHYVVQALAESARPVAAFQLLRTRFAPMMERSDTIWESWSRHAQLSQITEESRDVPVEVPDGRFETVRGTWRPSWVAIAHCGGVGAAYLLLTEVLGIKPAAPGFDGCIITPQIGLLDKAAGTYPSPRGDVKVAWERAGRGTKLTVELPSGLSAELRLPGGARKLGPGRHEVSV